MPKKDVPKKEAPKKEPAAKKEVVPKKDAPKKAAATTKDGAKKVAGGPAKTVKKGVTTAGKGGKDKKPTTKKVLRVVKAKKSKTRPTKFYIDCSAPVEDGIMDPASFVRLKRLHMTTILCIL